MRGLRIHILSRLQSLCYRPLALGLLLLSVAPAIWLWPHPSFMGWALAEPSVPRMEFLVVWCWLFPILPALCIRGRVTGNARDVMTTLAIPTLPVRLQTRVIAELLLSVLLLLLARVIAYFLYTPPFVPFLEQTILGLCLFAPFLVAWATPTQHDSSYTLKPMFLALLLYSCMKLGWMHSNFVVLPICFGLAIAAWWTITWDVSLGVSKEKTSTPALRFRQARSPNAQFLRDLWLNPVQQFGWHLFGLGLVLAGLLVAEWFTTVPDIAVYVVSCLFVGFLIFVVALRPMGSQTALSGMARSYGGNPGDFLRACTLFPLSQRTILRSVYVYVLVVGLAAMVVVVGILAYYSILRTGELTLVSQTGRPLLGLLVTMFVVAPCLAGALTANLVGDRLATRLSTGVLVTLMPLYALVHVGLHRNGGPAWVYYVLLAVFAVAGSIPPLRWLTAFRDGPTVNDLIPE